MAPSSASFTEHKQTPLDDAEALPEFLMHMTPSDEAEEIQEEAAVEELQMNSQHPRKWLNPS